jgi:sugar lactone lactonase YvrE
MVELHPLFRSGLGLFREAKSAAARSLWWDPAGALYWCDPAIGAVHRGALGGATNGSDDGAIALPPPLAAFAPASDGFVIAGRNAVALVSRTGGFLRALARVPLENDGFRFGAGACDPYGRLVVATVDLGGGGDGTIYWIDQTGAYRPIYTRAGAITGMQWSDDGSRMWFTDTRLATIFSCDYSPSGDMTNVQPMVRGRRCSGLARDAIGGFWAGTYDDGRIARWDEAGNQTLELEIPAARVTSVVFGGAELSTLFIATGREGLTDQQLAARPLTGSLFGIETATKGYPTRPFGRPQSGHGSAPDLV